MNSRALVISLAMAAIGSALLLLYMRRFESETSGGERVPVLVAVKPIEVGAVLTEEMLAERQIPTAYLEDRAIKAVDRHKVLGLQAATTIQPQQSLMWTDLAIITEDRPLSSLVQPGKRGFTVRTVAANDTRGNELIRPGDYVDVIVTMNDSQNSEERRSVVLLQKIIVLAVGYDTRNASNSPTDRGRDSSGASNEKVLTLSLSLQESQLLALALERGRISVAVRNVTDQRITNDVPDLKSTTLADMFARRGAAAAAHPTGPVRIESSGQL
jgi:pilus assembly protein CpaB